MILKAFVAIAAVQAVACVNAATTLGQLKYTPLPLGNIQATGWLQSQLEIQVNGLAGHLHDFFPYVSESTWTGGGQDYSDLNEGGAYWFDGLVATAFVSGDSRLLGQVQSFLDYIISNQASDGWLGPEPRTLWGRYPALKGMMQFAQADPTQTQKIVTSMMKFVTLAHSMLANNGTGVEEWGASRWQDFALVVQWLYENHPSGQQAMLLDTMRLLRSTGADWASIFSPANFPTTSVSSDAASVQNHGVNLGQALKEAAVAWRFSNSSADIANTAERWNILYQYHGMPSGIFNADEHLAGQNPARGTELCTIVETMYSGSYTYQAFGNNSIADLVERMAYNALPATLTSNMWSHQYLQQMNQIWVQNMGNNPFATDGGYSNVMGLQPNYPCCTVNHPQGFPKYISNAFVTAHAGAALVQVYLAPVSVRTTLAGSNGVNVTVATNYPFADTLHVTTSAQKAYTHYVRVPEWAKRAGQATIALNGAAAKALKPNADSLFAVAVPAGQYTFDLSLPAAIDVVPGAVGVSVSRGPLLFASDIFRQETTLATSSGNPNAIDIQMTPTAGYNYAIDPETLAFHNALPATLSSPVFEGQRPPNTISAVGCPVTWGNNGDYVNDPPSSPATCTGAQFNFIFWPYGACKLRISELPTFKSS